MNRNPNEHYLKTRKAILARKDFQASVNLDPYRLRKGESNPYHLENTAGTYVVDWQLSKGKVQDGMQN